MQCVSRRLRIDDASGFPQAIIIFFRGASGIPEPHWNVMK